MNTVVAECLDVAPAAVIVCLPAAPAEAAAGMRPAQLNVPVAVDVAWQTATVFGVVSPVA